MLSLVARRMFATYGLLLAVYVLSPPVAPALEAGADDRYAFGVRLNATAPDATPWLLTLSPEFCYIDGDGVGSYSAGEPVYLRSSSGCTGTNPGVGAIRLAAFAGNPAGARIRGGDSDGPAPARTFTPDAARFKYLDTNQDGRLSPGDAVYADVLAITSNRVDVGDVRITEYDSAPRGVHVASGDGDVGSSIASMGDLNQVVAYADADGSNAFSSGDSMYLRSEPSSSPGHARVGDARLGGHDAGSFGTWLELGDDDAPARLRRAADVQFCLAGDAEYEEGDTIVLRNSPCTGTATAADHRLAGPSATGARLNSLGADLIFQNREGGAGFDLGDLLFLDLGGSATRIDAGDLRLVAHDGLAAGVAVRAGDDDAGRSATRLGDASSYLGFVDMDGDGSYDRGDVMYVNRDGAWTTNAEDVEVGDVRLEAAGDLPAGQAVTTGSPEVVVRLTTRSFHACIVDSDGDNQHDPEEPAYLNPDGCSTIQAGSIRLLARGGDGAGSAVQSGSEVGAGLSSVSTQLSYLDADGSATWTEGDTLYVRFGSGQANVRAGDIRLTAYGDKPGGTSVTGSDVDRDQPLVTLSTSMSSGSSYFDADGSGTFSTGDPVYLAPVSTTAQTATFGQVRLAALAAPASAPAPGGTAPPDEVGAIEDDLNETEDDLDDQLGETQDSDGDGYADVVEEQRGTNPNDPDDYPGKKKDSQRQPGFAVVAALAALAFALFARRRR